MCEWVLCWQHASWRVLTCCSYEVIRPLLSGHSLEIALHFFNPLFFKRVLIKNKLGPGLRSSFTYCNATTVLKRSTQSTWKKYSKKMWQLTVGFHSPTSVLRCCCRETQTLCFLFFYSIPLTFWPNGSARGSSWKASPRANSTVRHVTQAWVESSIPACVYLTFCWHGQTLYFS